MPKALTPSQRDSITCMLSERKPHKEIAVAAGCSLSQVKRMSQNMRRFGKPTRPKVKIQGRPRILPPEVIDVYCMRNKAEEGTGQLYSKLSLYSTGGIGGSRQCGVQNTNDQVNSLQGIEKIQFREQSCILALVLTNGSLTFYRMSRRN